MSFIGTTCPKCRALQIVDTDDAQPRCDRCGELLQIEIPEEPVTSADPDAEADAQGSRKWWKRRTRDTRETETPETETQTAPAREAAAKKAPDQEPDDRKASALESITQNITQLPKWLRYLIAALICAAILAAIGFSVGKHLRSARDDSQASRAEKVENTVVEDVPATPEVVEIMTPTETPPTEAEVIELIDPEPTAAAAEEEDEPDADAEEPANEEPEAEENETEENQDGSPADTEDEDRENSEDGQDNEVEADGDEEQDGDESSEGSVIDISSDIQYAANIFLSNFAEQHFPDYSQSDNDSTEARVSFAHLYAKANARSLIDYTDDDGAFYETMELEDVDDIADRFFLDGVSSDQAEDYDAADGFYRDYMFYFTPADGEAMNRFTVVKSMTRMADYTYLFEFNIYSLDMDEFEEEGLSSYYYMSPEEAEDDSLLTRESSGTALVRSDDPESRDAYELLSYSTD